MKQEDQESGDDGENSERESDGDESTESVDKTMKEDLCAIFLYKSYYDVNDQQPDFLTYRLPLMFLAIKTDPYFFKVNKIRFKPYGCANEMEFIQMQWPIQLNKLYDDSRYDASNHKGWSGPMFNEWATKDESPREKRDPCVESAPLNETTSNGDDEKDDGNNSDAESDSTYHRAYIQAELKPKNESNGHGFFDSTRGFNILITALVGGVWDLEEDPTNYTCEHLAEMRTVKEEILCETRSHRYGNHKNFFYKRVRMLSNYWQCYLAGETNYLVGVNGAILRNQEESGDETKKGRQINELRLYDVSKIPDFIKKCGAEQGFRPWSKEILQNRLYKSLQVIYDKVKDAPVDTEFTFVKYNVFDPPIHDVDGSITGPYLLAFRQLILEGLPTPRPPKLLTKLMVFIGYPKFVELVTDKKFKREDLPLKEEKDGCITLTFHSVLLRDFYLNRVDSMLEYMKEKDKFPAECGFENLNIKKVFMKKPVPQCNNSSQSWRSSNHEQQQTTRNNNRTTPIADSPQSWRNSNIQQPHSSSWNYENSWRRRDSAGAFEQSWRSSNNQQQQQQSNLRNNSWRQEGASANFREHSRNIDDSSRRRYGGRVNNEENWRRKLD